MLILNVGHRSEAIIFDLEEPAGIIERHPENGQWHGLELRKGYSDFIFSQFVRMWAAVMEPTRPMAEQ